MGIKSVLSIINKKYVYNHVGLKYGIKIIGENKMINFELVHMNGCSACDEMIDILDELIKSFDFTYDKIEINTVEGQAKRAEFDLNTVPILFFENEIIITGKPADETDVLDILIKYLYS